MDFYFHRFPLKTNPSIDIEITFRHPCETSLLPNSRMTLVRPSRRRTYHVFQFLTSSIGILAAAGGGYIAYAKLPGGNTIDGLKNTHAILGTAVLGVAVLVFVLGIFAGFNKKRVGYSHGLQLGTLIMVGLAAAASWYGLEKYTADAGKSNKVVRKISSTRY